MAALRGFEFESLGVEQFQPFAAILDADGGISAFVVFHNVVLGQKYQGVVFYLNRDEDGAVFRRGGSIFKRVFDKGDKQHGWNLKLWCVDVGFENDVGMMIQPEPLQIDVVVQIFNFALNVGRFVDRVTVGVLQNVGKLGKSALGLVRLGDHEAVNRVECVEQEVGVDLRLVQ